MILQVFANQNDSVVLRDSVNSSPNGILGVCPAQLSFSVHNAETWGPRPPFSWKSLFHVHNEFAINLFPVLNNCFHPSLGPSQVHQ